MFFGNKMNFGGFFFGFFVVKDVYKCEIFGCVVGQMKDLEGCMGYVLIFMVCEQYIKWDCVIFNICFNQGFIVLCANIFLQLVGFEGLKGFVEQNVVKVQYLQSCFLELLDWKFVFLGFIFNEFVETAYRDWETNTKP